MNETDLGLMLDNLRRIESGEIKAMRVSAEHYAWLAGWRSQVLAIVDAAGGAIEGHPTSTINILQRVRQLCAHQQLR